MCVNASTHSLKVEGLFLAVPQGCLRFVIVVFPDHTHLLFLAIFQVTLMPQSSSYTIFSCKYISTLLVGCSNFKLLQVLRSHDVDGTGNISCKRRSFAMVYHRLNSE